MVLLRLITQIKNPYLILTLHRTTHYNIELSIKWKCIMYDIVISFLTIEQKLITRSPRQ